MTDPNALPTSSEPRGLCTRCGHLTAFNMTANQPLDNPHGGNPQASALWATTLVCQGCQQGVVVVQRAIGRDANGYPITFEGQYWWPAPGARQLDEAVPADCAAAFDEGMRCLGVQAPHAAVCMFRVAVAYVVQDKGSDAARGKRVLSEQLRQMATDGSLYPTLAEWAEQVKDLGNAGAHPGELGQVSMAEAQELGQLCRELLAYLYDMPARLVRQRAQRAGA